VPPPPLTYAFGAPHYAMSQTPTTYVTSPQGKHRVWVGIMALGLPTLLVFGYFYFHAADPSNREWHVSGMAKVLCQLLLLTMLVSMFAAGLYLTLLVRTVVLDMQGGGVTRIAQLFGNVVHRKTWSLSEFTRIELNHRCAGSDTDTYQSDVGLRLRSGTVIWLRAFRVESDKPSPEALTFAKQLGDMTGLRYEK
jgi:hypothetical protein